MLGSFRAPHQTGSAVGRCPTPLGAVSMVSLWCPGDSVPRQGVLCVRRRVAETNRRRHVPTRQFRHTEAAEKASGGSNGCRLKLLRSITDSVFLRLITDEVAPLRYAPLPLQYMPVFQQYRTGVYCRRRERKRKCNTAPVLICCRRGRAPLKETASETDCGSGDR